MDTIEADYLVVDAGAMGIAFNEQRSIAITDHGFQDWVGGR